MKSAGLAQGFGIHSQGAKVAADNVVAMKISGTRVGRSPIPQVEVIGEDFTKLLDDRLRKLLKTITSSIILECEVKKLSRVLESIPVPAMIGVVDVRGSDNRALVNVSNDLIYHLVDLRMGGDSSQSPVPTARSITPLDCTLCSDFVSTLLSAFSAAVELNLGAAQPDVLSLSHFEQHVTMARIAPENADVLFMQVSLDVGDAARSGDFDLVIPLSILDRFKAASEEVQTEIAPSANDLWARRMNQAAREARLPLTSVIHRLHLDIGSIQSWSPGDVLPLPSDARQKVELMAPGRADEPVVVARLGAVDGQKALKLADSPDPSLVHHIRHVTGGAQHG